MLQRPYGPALITLEERDEGLKPHSPEKSERVAHTNRQTRELYIEAVVAAIQVLLRIDGCKLEARTHAQGIRQQILGFETEVAKITVLLFIAERQPPRCRHQRQLGTECMEVSRSEVG